MKINWQSGWAAGTQQLLIPISNNQGDLQQNLEKITNNLGVHLTSALEDFKAESGETLVLYGQNSKVFLLGLGNSPGFAEVFRAARLFSARQKSKLSSTLCIYLEQSTLPTDQQITCIEALVNGLHLGIYDAGKYKSTELIGDPLAFAEASLYVYFTSACTSVNMTLGYHPCQRYCARSRVSDPRSAWRTSRWSST